ncbi:MAG: hypothetical protein FJ034_02385 [Chloroflexi bacterium]|nr:hypothetical protein [Chloroflexota bacterium]
MNEAELLETWRVEEAQPFSGWDFSHIARRKTDRAFVRWYDRWLARSWAFAITSDAEREVSR